MYRRKKARSKKVGFFRRAMRSTISITVLTTLILSISLLVREISSIDSESLANMSEPLLASLGIDSEVVGEVAGNLAVRNEDPNSNQLNSEVLQGDIGSASTSREAAAISDDSAVQDNKVLDFSIAVFADSHSDIDNLNKALQLASERDATAVFHLGDHTDLGVVRYLTEAKTVLDNSGFDYYALPGDRDLWESVGPDNFISVFGENNHSVEINGYKFVLLDNSANYTVIPESTMQWFEEEVQTADFVLLSQPLYHPTSDKVMGTAAGEEVGLLKKQAEALLVLIRDSNVKAIIAAEQHLSSVNVDPEKDSLSHFVVGAITSTINDKPQELLQTSRFSLLNIYEDETYKIENIILP